MAARSATGDGDGPPDRLDRPSRGYFEPKGVQHIIDQHMSGIDRSSHLYALLMLELWHREVLVT
jgi:hypothetical protein